MKRILLLIAYSVFVSFSIGQTIDFQTNAPRSGYIEASSTSYTYRYYMKDNLGNIRVVSTLSGSIMQTNHYYPYQLQCTWHSASNSCG